jgi:cobalt-zinc-cadmium efflux system protein
MIGPVGPGHPHGADRQTAAGRHRRALVWALGLNGSFLVVEVLGSVWTGSLALLADAGHMLTDLGGLVLALVAIWFSGRPATPAKSYGYYRVEILAALVNAVVLLAVSGFVLYEAYRRLLAPPEILAGPMLVIAALGLAANVAGLALLRAGSTESLNLRGAYLEVLSDAVASLGVMAAAAIVLATGWYVVDPLVSAGIGLFIVPRTWGLLRQAVNVLLEGTPPHVDLVAVEAAMREVPGVRRVHDLHVWTLTSGKDAMSGHVVVDDVAEADRLTTALHDLLHERFGIAHTTIQVESLRLVQVSLPDEGRSRSA